MSKVLICGSRDYEITVDKMYRDLIDTINFLSEIAKETITVDKIISGGATGPDSVAIKMCERYNIPCIVNTPDWASWGRAAGPMRNKQMVDMADIVIAYWDGKSKGTESTIKFTEEENKLGMIFYPEGYKEKDGRKTWADK
jgi:hypothetical protein